MNVFLMEPRLAGAVNGPITHTQVTSLLWGRQFWRQPPFHGGCYPGDSGHLCFGYLRDSSFRTCG